MITWHRLFFLLLIIFVNCSDPPLFELKVITPPGIDPLAKAERLRVILTNPASEKSIILSNKEHFSLELETAVQGNIASTIVEGFYGSDLVARGETPPLVLSPLERQLNLLIAHAGTLSSLEPQMTTAGQDMTSLLLSGLGVLLAGGKDINQAPQSNVSLYDFFQHQLLEMESLPEPRASAVAASCGSICGIIILGDNHQGLASQILRYNGTSWETFADQLPSVERRRNATIATGDEGDTYLIFGGEGESGPLNTVLKLVPAASPLVPTMEVLLARTLARRVYPAVAAANGIVLVAGGMTNANGPIAELYSPSAASSQALLFPEPAPINGCSTTELDDGRLVIIGGRDAAGTLLKDAWIIDPTTSLVTQLKDILREGRADHRAIKVKSEIVVLGGVITKGLAETAEVLEAKSLAQAAQIPIPAPRSHFVVERLGTGSLLIAGGVNQSAGQTTLEVYETSSTTVLP